MLLNLDLFRSRLKELQGTSSVAAFAKSLGISQPAMNYYIKGERKPSVELIMKLCYNYKVSFEWLVGLSDVRETVSEFAPKLSREKFEHKHSASEARLLAEIRALKSRVAALESQPSFACG